MHVRSRWRRDARADGRLMRGVRERRRNGGARRRVMSVAMRGAVRATVTVSGGVAQTSKHKRTE